MKGKFFFYKNKHHIGVVHVPYFHLSARSSSFFNAFFFHFNGKPFYGSPHMLWCFITRPDTRPMPVTDGCSGTGMHVFTLSNSMTLDGPTDGSMDGRTKPLIESQIREKEEKQNEVPGEKIRHVRGPFSDVPPLDDGCASRIPVSSSNTLWMLGWWKCACHVDYSNRHLLWECM